MSDPLLLPELRGMLLENDAAGLKEFCEVLHPATAADNLAELSPTDFWKVLSCTNLNRQVEIFEYVGAGRQRQFVADVDRQHLTALLEEMAPDDRADLLESLDPDQLEALLPLIAQAERSEIRKLLSYPDDSAGSVMTTEYASLPEDITVREAINQLRLQAPNRETIYYVYVLDEGRRLRGFITLRKLILARPETLLSQIIERDVISVRVDDDRELVANKMARYDFIAIPVVDEQNRLVGIITHDDVLDVLQKEATEDVHRMGAVDPFDENYLEASFILIWRKRAAWLSCLFVAELLTYTALGRYEHAIKAVVVLSLFVPLCISTGGNSGSQAATLITRAMTLGQVKVSDWWRVVRHELAMGLALGLTLGCIGFLRGYFTSPEKLDGADRMTLAIVIAQSTATICLWGTLVGAVLPILFRRVGVDPAIASSPFVATFVDVTGIVIYFNVAYAHGLIT